MPLILQLATINELGVDDYESANTHVIRWDQSLRGKAID